MDLILRQQLEDFGFSANKCVLTLPCARELTGVLRT